MFCFVLFWGQLIYYYNYTEEDNAKEGRLLLSVGKRKHNWMTSIDRIIQLLDEILVSILSLLLLKEATITSIYHF